LYLTFLFDIHYSFEKEIQYIISICIIVIILYQTPKKLTLAHTSVRGSS